MIDTIIWFGIGITIGSCIGVNLVSISKQRLYYQNQIKSKDKEIELIKNRLETCQKWSKKISEENKNLRKDPDYYDSELRCYWGG
jgi:hypothetical protein